MKYLLLSDEEIELLKDALLDTRRNYNIHPDRYNKFVALSERLNVMKEPTSSSTY